MERNRDCGCYEFCDIFRFGDQIQVTNSITDTGIFISLQGNQLIWVRYDNVAGETRIVYSPFNEVTVEKI